MSIGGLYSLKMMRHMPTALTDRETSEVARANQSGKQPVVFIHGLWLLASSWDSWADLFEQAGYAAVKPGWPDDPETVADARAQPDAFARKGVGQVADHMETVIRRLTRKPAVIGHSFGGVLAQIIAGRGLAAVSVAVDPAPFRGVLPLPFSALRAASPALSNPANVNRAVSLSSAQFRFAFANAVDADEAKNLYEKYAVPAPGKPLFQAAFANINPRTEVRVDTMNPDRGPMLLISGDRDNTVPWAIVSASYKLQKRNPGTTEVARIPNRGHSLTIDSGWQEVANTGLDFVRRAAKS